MITMKTKNPVGLWSMYKTACVIGLVVLIAGCSDNRMESRLSELEMENFKLKQIDAQRNEFVDEFITTVNAVDDNLKVIAEYQHLVGSDIEQSNGSLSQKEGMLRNLDLIREYIKKNERHLSELTSKLASSDKEVSALQKLVSSLKEQNRQKDIELEGLKSQVEELSNEVGRLSDAVRERDRIITESAESISNLNKANESITKELEKAKRADRCWIAKGSKKALKRNGIIQESGTFKKSYRLASTPSDSGFQSYLVDEISEIRVEAAVKNIQLVNERAPGSFRIDPLGEKFSVIVITDRDEFWKYSNYLAVMIKE